MSRSGKASAGAPFGPEYWSAFAAVFGVSSRSKFDGQFSGGEAFRRLANPEDQRREQRIRQFRDLSVEAESEDKPDLARRHWHRMRDLIANRRPEVVKALEIDSGLGGADRGPNPKYQA